MSTIIILKNDHQQQEDLTKYGYKTNREVENLRILLHVSDQLEPIN
jgi:hypothetical protein